MEPITVREARRGDEQAIARIHAEVARYYLDLAPDYFQVLERFAEQLATEAPAKESATLHLVAEAEGQIVGALIARLLPPEDSAKREITPELEATSLRIEYLAVAAASRRQGVGGGMGTGGWRDGRRNDDLPRESPLGSVLGGAHEL